MRYLGRRCWLVMQRITYCVIKMIYKVFDRELKEEVFSSYMQFFKFGLIGVSNTILFYIVYLPCLTGFKFLRILSDIDYVVAQIFAFSVSVMWSFFWNNKYVFTLEDSGKRSFWKSMLKTYCSYSFTGIFLNSALLFFWVRVCCIPETIAPAINLIVSVPLNFIINKYWAFRGEQKK